MSDGTLTGVKLLRDFGYYLELCRCAGARSEQIPFAQKTTHTDMNNI
jgi:hypothetical protein